MFFTLFFSPAGSVKVARAAVASPFFRKSAILTGLLTVPTEIMCL